MLFSLTALKALTLIFDYGRFQRAVAGKLRKDKGKQIVLIDIGVSLIGLAILTLTLLVY